MGVAAVGVPRVKAGGFPFHRTAGGWIVLALAGVPLCAFAARAIRSVGAPSASPEPLLLEVTGSAFEWQVRYAGADGQLGTSDDRRATGGPHLPADTSVILRLTSSDYLYSFAVPALGLHEVAVPERTYELRFRSPAATTLELRGDQFCGFRHPRLMSTIPVEPSADFERWLSRLAPAGDGAPEPTLDTNRPGKPLAARPASLESQAVEPTAEPGVPGT